MRKVVGVLFLGAIATVAVSVIAEAQQRNRQQRERRLSATQRGTVTLEPADRVLSPSEVFIEVRGDTRIVRTNGIPEHAVGAFPNSGNPHAITEQNFDFRMTTDPAPAGRITSADFAYWGVGLSGIPFEPGTAEYWKGDRNSGWNYDALGGAVRLGLDANYAHVQPNGAYHYHFTPIGLMEELNWDGTEHSPLIGWAADGYPVYVLTGDLGNGMQEVRSSYRLKAGRRPGGSQPDGTYDGTFVEDYEYVAGLGDLDECNGARTTSREFPQGTYAYFLTEEFPFVPRCWTGTPDDSFSERPRR